MNNTQNNSAQITVQYEEEFAAERPPSPKQVISILNTVLPNSTEITVRFVSGAESKKLNKKYLAKDKVANVLAFPYHDTTHLSGDIAICPQVVVAEATQCNVSVEERYVHLLIHAALHLLGLSHDNDANAKVMESKENELMQELGYPAPYENN